MSRLRTERGNEISGHPERSNPPVSLALVSAFQNLERNFEGGVGIMRNRFGAGLSLVSLYGCLSGVFSVWQGYHMCDFWEVR